MDVSESISGCRQASAVLLDGVGAGAGWTDATARQPSLLPGWSVGHVLTHLARNADSHRRMAEAAAEGRVVDQYPGGPVQREAEIEAGARRPAGQILDDLRASRVGAAGRPGTGLAPEVVGPGTVAAVAPSPGRWPEQPFLRWREVALHSSDLGLDGLAAEQWSDAYVDHELRRQLAALAPRLPGRPPVDVVVTDRGWDVVVMGTAPRHRSAPVATVAGTARRSWPGWSAGGPAPRAVAVRLTGVARPCPVSRGPWRPRAPRGPAPPRP